ncbi:hypothetical protein [Halorubrum sp. DTA98]|uniref:hypothetical protein n=1 Tax=Halorubrum sp. DTA98 TaxID=3402163 RepID=UPI003AAB9E45
MFNNHKISETLIDPVESVEDTITTHYSSETPPDEGSLNGYLALALADKLNESSRNNDTIEIYSEPYTKTKEKRPVRILVFGFSFTHPTFLSNLV